MKRDLLRKFGWIGVFILSGVIANAGTVTLLNPDIMGQSSFDSGLNWSDSTAPNSANDYVVAGDKMTHFRTPVSTENFTFGGNSLTIAGGLMLFKAGKSATFTFNGGGLILDGGMIQNASNNMGALCTIAGNFTVSPKGGAIQFSNGSFEFVCAMNLNGPLRTENGGTVTPKFNGPVNFGLDGKLTAIQTVTFVQAMASVFTFEIGDRDSAYITGQGGCFMKGTFVFKVGPEDLVTGHKWKIVDTANKTFAESFSVSGYSKASGIWTSSDGNYQFSETTGVLSVVDKSRPGDTGTPAAADKPDIEKAKVSPVAAKPSVTPAPVVAKPVVAPAKSSSSVAAPPTESSNWLLWVVCGVGLLVAGGLVVLVIMLLRTFKS